MRTGSWLRTGLPPLARPSRSTRLGAGASFGLALKVAKEVLG